MHPLRCVLCQHLTTKEPGLGRSGEHTIVLYSCCSRGIGECSQGVTLNRKSSGEEIAIKVLSLHDGCFIHRLTGYENVLCA